MSRFPKMALFRQRLFSAPLPNAEHETASALAEVLSNRRIAPGARVAVAVGSRGIDRINEVVGACVRVLLSAGCKPFVVPAMGSHGGGTPAGQAAVLKELGISESTVSVPVKNAMDVVHLGDLEEGLPVYFSRDALEADCLVVINRIKPHTKFNGPIESGISKMLSIGLGKAAGAQAYHRWAVGRGFGFIENAAAFICQRIQLLCGIGLVEDGHGKLSQIEAVTPERLADSEKQLLKKAAQMMGRIPVMPVDVLIVDQFGKDISGIGMDSNVTGRHRDIVGDFFLPPHIQRIFVRDLSPHSDGNANGIGLADVTTRRLVEKMNLEKTYANAIAAVSLEKAAIPIHFETDREALKACAAGLGMHGLENARVVRIESTKQLVHVCLSEAFRQEAQNHGALEQMAPWRPMAFGPDGNLSELPIR